MWVKLHGIGNFCLIICLVCGRSWHAVTCKMGTCSLLSLLLTLTVPMMPLMALMITVIGSISNAVVVNVLDFADFEDFAGSDRHHTPDCRQCLGFCRL